MKAIVNNNPVQRIPVLSSGKHLERKNTYTPKKQTAEKINWSDEPYSPALAARILEARANIARGEYIQVNTMEDLRTYLDSFKYRD